jgi:hypothetical protein
MCLHARGRHLLCAHQPSRPHQDTHPGVAEHAVARLPMLLSPTAIIPTTHGTGPVNACVFYDIHWQVARKAEGQVATFREVVQELLREDGPTGFFRGVLPRMASSALWGTAMVTVRLRHISAVSEVLAAWCRLCTAILAIPQRTVFLPLICAGVRVPQKDQPQG